MFLIQTTIHNNIRIVEVGFWAGTECTSEDAARKHNEETKKLESQQCQTLTEAAKCMAIMGLKWGGSDYIFG